MKRFVIVTFLLTTLFTGITTAAWSQHRHQDEVVVLQPGDKDYEHERYHEPYQRFWRHVNGVDDLQPSDHNYMSEKFGPTYKKLYAGGKCACKAGYCRPTKWRLTELGAPSGYDILVNRQWMPVPEGALHNEKTLPPELWAELMKDADAHVCAYPDESVVGFGQRIECAIVPGMIG
jgi:hypothetical protein